MAEGTFGSPASGGHDTTGRGPCARRNRGGRTLTVEGLVSGWVLMTGLVTGCVQGASPEGQETAAESRARIVRAGDEFIQMYSNPDTAISYFTPDAVLVPPTGSPVVGHDALLAHLRAGNDGATWDQSATRDTIFVSGNMAVERGRYRVALLGGTSTDPVFVATGPYLIHWAMHEGRWRIATYMGAADP